MPRIGLISDTHNLLRSEALAFLAGCDHIVHGGDIGGPDILARLSPSEQTTHRLEAHDTGKTVRADLAEVFLLTVAWLFLIPVATLFFTNCKQRTQDTALLARVERQVAA